MSGDKRIPVALKIVAVLFLFSGLMSLVDIIIALTQGRLSVNFGVLGLFIGPGLLQLKRTWRIWALVFTAFGLIVSAAGVVLFLTATDPPEFVWFGVKKGPAPRELAAGLAAAIFLIMLWQLRVLTRPDVRELFRKPTAQAAEVPADHP